MREGLKLLIETDFRLRVVAIATSGEEAVAAVHKTRPDVIVVDLVLPDKNAVGALARLSDTSATAPVIVLTSGRSVLHLDRALRAGVRGYVEKTAAAVELLCAIVDVGAGKQYVSSRLLGLLGLLGAGRQASTRHGPGLSAWLSA